MIFLSFKEIYVKVEVVVVRMPSVRGSFVCSVTSTYVTVTSKYVRVELRSDFKR